MSDGWITIGSGQLTAAINPFGAELSSLKDRQGRELMTDADPAYWTGRAPVLFPVVGKPAGEVIRVDGRDYPMKQHGFARRLPFAVEEAGPARASFMLRDTKETRARYPFAFLLRLVFEVTDATLAVTAEVENPGDQPLPASLGFHPAFAWPLPSGGERDGHRITFADDEPEPIREIAADATIAPGTRPSPLDGRTLRLHDGLFAHDALVWDRVRSRGATYRGPSGPQLRVAWDAPMLGIWSKPGARFVCVEPWHGIADPEGYAGEFRDKPGVFEVMPGDTWRTTMTVTLLA